MAELIPQTLMDADPIFWGKVNFEAISTEIVHGNCWLYGGFLSKTGYGQKKIRNKTGYAHRHAWELANGQIPEGLVIDHLCRNRNCLNPKHMELVTGRQNTLRGIGPSAMNAKRDTCLKGHKFDATYCFGGQVRRRCTICNKECLRLIYLVEKLVRQLCLTLEQS